MLHRKIQMNYLNLHQECIGDRLYFTIAVRFFSGESSPFPKKHDVFLQIGIVENLGTIWDSISGGSRDSMRILGLSLRNLSSKIYQDIVRTSHLNCLKKGTLGTLGTVSLQSCQQEIASCKFNTWQNWTKSSQSQIGHINQSSTITNQ